MVNSVKFFFEITHEILYVLNKEQRKRLVYVFFVIILGSFMELIGVGIILPFIQAVVNPTELMNNTIMANVCNWLNITEPAYIVAPIGIGIIFIYLIKNAFIIYSKYVQIDYATKLQKDLSVYMLQSYMKRPYTYFIDVNSSYIRSVCNDAVGAYYFVIEALLGVVSEVITVILIGSYLIYTDWITALGTLALLGIVLVSIVLGFKPFLKRAGIVNKQTAFERAKSISQATEGIKDILVMKRSNSFISSFEQAADRARRSSRTYSVLAACPDRITEGLCVSGIIGIVCLRLIGSGSSMSAFIPKLAMFAMATFKILPSVGKIVNRINSVVYNRAMQKMVYENVVDTERYQLEYDEYTRTKVGLSEVASDKENSENCDEEAQEIGSKDFTIKCVDIEWKYTNQERPVLKKLNLYVRKGESIGLVGPSGAGKTTTADILLGLLRPQKGTVTIEDKDIFAMPEVWAKLIGYVPQTVFLIDDTIRENVIFGSTNTREEDVWDALERAQLKDYVLSLPEGIDTVIGERGVKLSGGQRQRIAIARALFSKPQILVLDEATAALDNETEKAVMDSIEVLQGSVTLIIVAHRLTTIRKCDRIYEIAGGIATEKNKAEVI